MQLAEVAAPLLLVIDPFGNLPFVVAVLARLPLSAYLAAITREVAIAALVLSAFVWGGQRLLVWFGIEETSLRIAGGVVLFLIALKMVFGKAAELFSEGEIARSDPIAVPIAMPAIAGPSAVATVLFFASREDVAAAVLQSAVLLALGTTWLVLALGRWAMERLPARVFVALEKLSGMVLLVWAVDSVLDGVRAALR